MVYREGRSALMPTPCCKVNGGASGVEQFRRSSDIEAYGAERWLDELTQDLKQPGI